MYAILIWGPSINDVRILSKYGFTKSGHFRTEGGKGTRKLGRPKFTKKFLLFFA